MVKNRLKVNKHKSESLASCGTSLLIAKHKIGIGDVSRIIIYVPVLLLRIMSGQVEVKGY